MLFGGTIFHNELNDQVPRRFLVAKLIRSGPFHIRIASEKLPKLKLTYPDYIYNLKTELNKSFNGSLPIIQAKTPNDFTK